MVERVDDPLRVADPLSHVAKLAAERKALGDRIRGADGGATAVERVGESGGVSGAAGELDRLPAQPVAAIPRGLVAKRSSQAGEQPGPQLDVLLGERGEPSSSNGTSRSSPRGPRPHEATAVTGSRAGQLTRQAEASGDAGGVEEGPLCRRESPAATSCLAEGEQELAARLLVRRVRELERLERHLVQARSLLVGEERERAISGAPGVAKALVEVPPGDRVVRELGQVGSGLVAVERLERLDGLPV